MSIDVTGAEESIVRVAGEIDAASSVELCAALAAAGSQAHRLVVDLEGVAFIDAAGIDVLVDAARAASAVGRTLVLRTPSAAVQRVLDLLSLDGILPVEGAS